MLERDPVTRTWSVRQTLLFSNFECASSSLSGDRLAVGLAEQEAVRIFGRSAAGLWAPLGDVLPVVVAGSGSFGSNVAISSNSHSITGDTNVASWGGCAVQPIGMNQCTAVVNSSGTAASLSAVGATSVLRNDVVLMAAGMPPYSTGYWIASLTAQRQLHLPIDDNPWVSVIVVDGAM